MPDPSPIVVVGSSNTDMVVKSRRLPAPGETVVGGTFVMGPGGKGANQAVAAARLGVPVRLLAKVGQDMFGDKAVEGYRQEGIDTSLVIRDASAHTGVALILVDDRGENLISVASGANATLTASDVDRAGDAIAGAAVLMLQLESPMPAVCRAAELAAAAGVPVILDPAPAPDEPLPAALLRNVTYLTPNETEAERLTGLPIDNEESARAAAARLLEMGAQNVVLTLGGEGALIATRQSVVLVAAQKVTAVDTTAAGDAFNGGLAASLADGRSLDDAVAQADIVAALSVTRLGAQNSLPTAVEVAAFRG